MCAPFRVNVQGSEHLSHSSGALVLSNHRRDSDGPILGRVLMQRQGFQISGVAPYFVGREDLFRQGFLEAYLETWPRAVRRLLGRVSVGPILRRMQVRPIRRIPEYTLGELLEDVYAVLGDVPLREVLRPPWVEHFTRGVPGVGSELSVSHALKAGGELLYQRYAFRRLNRRAMQALAPFERGVIASQLRLFVELLEAGETVLLEPEGKTSPDGHFHRPRQALHHLLNVPVRRPHVLPVALSYDSMCAGRARVLVRFGRPRYDLNGLSRRETDAAVRHAVLEQWTVTISHLAARYLRERGDTLLPLDAADDLARYVADMAARCEDLGVPIDPALLEPAARERRHAECVAYLHRMRRRDIFERLAFLDNELRAITTIHPGFLDGSR